MTNTSLIEIRQKLDDLKQSSYQLSEAEMKYRQNINDQIAKEYDLISKAQKELNSHPKGIGDWFGANSPQAEAVAEFNKLKAKSEANINELKAKMKYYSDAYRKPEKAVQKAKAMLKDAEKALEKATAESLKKGLSFDEAQAAEREKYNAEMAVTSCTDRLTQAEADFRNTEPFITKSVRELREELTASARKMIADKYADISEICSEVIAMASEMEGIENLERAYEGLPKGVTFNHLYTGEFMRIRTDADRKKGA